jgi:hypothetical protein
MSYKYYSFPFIRYPCLPINGGLTYWLTQDNIYANNEVNLQIKKHLRSLISCYSHFETYDK